MWEEKGFDLEVDWEADLEPGSSAGSGAALELVAQHLLSVLARRRRFPRPDDEVDTWVFSQANTPNQNAKQKYKQNY